MKKEIIQTADGSHTVSIPELKVTYHSVHGAIQESRHVFINAGLRFVLDSHPDEEIHLFEMGFGAGLNAFLTAIAALETKRKIHYIAVEAFPLLLEEIKALNYVQVLGHTDLFLQLHQCQWNEEVNLSEYFTIKKLHKSLFGYSGNQSYHAIYYDAFAPSAQPELWTKDVFDRLFTILKQNGVLVTYCSKGNVRRAMLEAGFTVQKLPGPPGKREMLRGVKS